MENGEVKTLPAKSGQQLHPQLPKAVVDKLQNAFPKANYNTPAWERLLTEKDRLRYQDYKGEMIRVWMDLHQVSQARAIIELAFQTGHMSEVDYRWLDRAITPVEAIVMPVTARRPRRSLGVEDEPSQRVWLSCKTHELVLVDDHREPRAYWRRKRIDPLSGRHGMIWNLVWELASAACRGSAIRHDHLLACTNSKTMKDRRSKLRKLIPADFDELIVPGPDTGTYRLDLPEKQIELFEFDSDEWLPEINEEVEKRFESVAAREAGTSKA